MESLLVGMIGTFGLVGPLALWVRLSGGESDEVLTQFLFVVVVLFGYVATLLAVALSMDFGMVILALLAALVGGEPAIQNLDSLLRQKEQWVELAVVVYLALLMATVAARKAFGPPLDGDWVPSNHGT